MQELVFGDIPNEWELLPSATARVYRTGSGVIRLLPRHLTRDQATDPLRRANLLADVGVPTPRPTYDQPHLTDHGWMTSYGDLGVSQPLDWYEIGQAVRLLHDRGTEALGNETLPRLTSSEYMQSRIDDAGDNFTPQERGVLQGWIPRLCDAAAKAARFEGPDVVVHDDLWPKNIVQTDDGPQLVDLDNLGLAPRAYDLAFITRARETGQIDALNVISFSAGYGQAPPPSELAWTYGYLHRLHWVIGLAARRADGEQRASEMLTIELPLWRHPEGPRKSP